MANAPTPEFWKLSSNKIDFPTLEYWDIIQYPDSEAFLDLVYRVPIAIAA